MGQREVKSVLWLDNDPAQIRPWVDALENSGRTVIVARGLLEAERFLDDHNPDLVIIDVMIPTRSEEEERIYTQELTDNSHSSGLFFYTRNRHRIDNALALTVRLDQSIRDRFLAEGFDAAHFATKFSLREIPTFLQKIDEIMR